GPGRSGRRPPRHQRDRRPHRLAAPRARGDRRGDPGAGRARQADREHVAAGRAGAARRRRAGRGRGAERAEQLRARAESRAHGSDDRAARRRSARPERPGAGRAGAGARRPRADSGGGGEHRARASPVRVAAAAARARRGAAARARGPAREARGARAGRADGRADAAPLAGRARAARHADSLGARPARQVRPDLRAGRGRAARARRAAGRDRARQPARTAARRRGELRRRSGQLHAGEDRDAARPPGAGLSREGPNPRRRRSHAARDRGQRVPRGRRGEEGVSDVAAAAGRDRPEIRLRGLRKRFGERTALDDVSLAIAGAQIVGVVGPDGAGKTTLLRAIAGLLEIEAEEASVLGFDLRGDVTDLKSRLGYVPQSFSLYRELTVEENLRVIGRLNRLDESAFDERARPLLERTGLAPFTDRQAGALSGGMKQKLAIAAALLPRPSLLV